MGQVVLWALTGACVVGLATLATVIYQLVRQQGRLLLKLDALELGMQSAPGAGGNGAGPQLPALSVGTEVEPFRLPDLEGEPVGLEDYRGKRVLLVHWSPDCGFCQQIAGELAELQEGLRRRNTELLLLSYGEAEPNRSLAEEHGLDCPILLQEPSEQLAAFHGLGTPVAYLLDEEGRVAAPLAVGANEVPELARAAMSGRKQLATERLLRESRIEREGLRAGTPAPAFALPDLDGDMVSLEDYRGRRALLVFSDPECGPCDALLPELVHLHDETTIILVSRGEIDENRRKAEEHALDFPVVVQKGWKLSKEYGIFATPVAFLVDEEGVIARDVAQGRDEILALAEEAQAREEAPMRS